MGAPKSNIVLLPEAKQLEREKLRLLLISLEDDSWKALWGRPKLLDIDPLSSQLTAKDLEIS